MHAEKPVQACKGLADLQLFVQNPVLDNNNCSENHQEPTHRNKDSADKLHLRVRISFPN